MTDTAWPTKRSFPHVDKPRHPDVLDMRTEYHKLPERFQRLDYFSRVTRFWRMFPPTDQRWSAPES